MAIVKEDGQNVVDAWYSAQRPSDQATFDNLLDTLSFYGHWNMPLARTLTAGACKGLRELRLKIERVQQRPLGSFGIRESCFVFLFWATERGGKWVPKDACARAQENKTLANEGRIKLEFLDV